MPEPIYDMRVNYNVVYHNDGTHDYYGYSARGTETSEAKWQIVKQEYDTGYTTAGDPFQMKWPNGSDMPVFEWDNVTTYDYKLLAKR